MIKFDVTGTDFVLQVTRSYRFDLATTKLHIATTYLQVEDLELSRVSSQRAILSLQQEWVKSINIQGNTIDVDIHLQGRK